MEEHSVFRIYKKENYKYHITDPFRASVFTPVFSGVRVAPSVVLWVVFCWSLYFLSFFNLRLLIIPLVSCHPCHLEALILNVFLWVCMLFDRSIYDFDIVWLAEYTQMLGKDQYSCCTCWIFCFIQNDAYREIHINKVCVYKTSRERRKGSETCLLSERPGQFIMMTISSWYHWTFYILQ
jgi:hypothetical protein